VTHAEEEAESQELKQHLRVPERITAWAPG
jgi:hypothetical protein